MATKKSPKKTTIKTTLALIKKYQHGIALCLLLALGLLTRFWLFGYPNTAVFDEVYFGKFVSAYYTHSYFFDIHPPLGKLLIAGFAWLFHYTPTQSFDSIGTVYTDNTYLILRFLPSLAAALLPVAVYSFARELGLKTRTALLVGLFIIFENTFIAQGRFILIDSFLFLFGFGGMWAYFAWRHRRGKLRLILAAALIGAAMSVKWTGLGFLAIPLICELVQYIRVKNLDRLMRTTAILIAIPVILYTTLFSIHISLLNRTGDGDAFMTSQFQKTLSGSTYEQDESVKPLPMLTRIVELNYQMYAANARLTATHPYASQWYSWPLMLRPISYWVDGEAQIWLFGNPVIWWGSTAGMIVLVYQLIRGKLKAHRKSIALLVVGAYVINMAPFIGITRVMFLYHYMIALVWALIGVGLLLDKVSAKNQAYLLGLVMITFFIVAPFTYGVSPDAFSTAFRTLLPSWR